MENKTKEIDLIELFYKLKKEKKLIVTINPHKEVRTKIVTINFFSFFNL